jgi:anti-sigma regulatory factor (Ser/Thr protein kinase)
VLRPPEGSRFAHQALLYDSRDAFLDAVMPFLRDGVAHGDAVILASPPEPREAVRHALTPAEAASVDVLAAGTHYARTAHALTRYQQLLSRHVRAGRRVRVVGEPPPATLRGREAGEALLTDAAFNAVCRFPGASVVCAYDERVVPPRLVASVRRSHSEVVEDGVRRTSPDYTDPHVLLGEDRHGRPLPEPRAEVAELASPRDAAEVRAFVHDHARRAGLAPPGLDDFLAAVNEIATNAQTHAVIDTVRVWRDRDHLVCEVRDNGPGIVDLLAGFRHPEPHWTAGRGLWLARQLTALLELRTGPGGTTVRLHAAVGQDG